MKKLDLKKDLKHLYQPSAKAVAVVDVPAMNFLMTNGAGDPNQSKAYADAVEALFAVSYTIKFMVKKSPLAVDYGVMPLEGLWWADDMASFTASDKSRWKWTMMIMQPEMVSSELVSAAINDVVKKKGLVAASKIRFETYVEGTCAQILHIGPFTAEGPTIEKVHAYIDAHGKRRGKHHEIYLSDIRKADPAKWKTVIRQPMA